ncbi:MAG: NAD-dependent succinate-semialdehyde dehydrogenase [Pseudomonadota bacterium]|nr:NAD-dependent succinate-semialdehyde dehydrogenase [Pseudomonadota bacterium]
MRLEDLKLLRKQAYVNGAWIDAESGATFTVTNPADGTLVGTVPEMGAAETRRAIAAAEAAFPAWSGKPAKERTQMLRRWMALIRDNLEDLANLMTSEQGKPLAEARNEITMGGNILEWYSEEARRVYGDMVPSLVDDKRILVMRQAIGVVGAITPWNFPHGMIVRKCAPALAAGCTVVIKPAEATPLSALALAELAARAEMPPGVLNIITTSRPSGVGGELTANPTVRKLSFTGSTAVGKLLMRQCADTIKKLSLELGGNAPFIVFEDADVEAAAAGAMASKFRNAGQTCVCANRFLVHDQVYDDFLGRFAQAASGLRVGPGLEGESQVGPLINEQALAKVERIVKDAVDKGARVVIGGKRHLRGGTFYEPTILADVTHEMVCTQEEIFGPVAPVLRFTDESQAIAMANDTRYGLASYFYSRSLGRVWRVAEAVDSGVVGVNVGNSASEVAPFGGMKESGIGREGGKYAMDEFVELKYVLLGGIDG